MSAPDWPYDVPPPADGGAAFPLAVTDGQFARDGMSLRDYFAGAVLQGAIANPGAAGASADMMQPLAAMAYEMADAMLVERAKALGA